MNDYDCSVSKNFVCEYQKPEHPVHAGPDEDMPRFLTQIANSKSLKNKRKEEASHSNFLQARKSSAELST